MAGGAMDDVVERVMASYENWERLGREEIRVKVGQYLEKLASAGHRDVEELTYYGLAYLSILREGLANVLASEITALRWDWSSTSIASLIATPSLVARKAANGVTFAGFLRPSRSPTK